ncbi:MAG: glutamate-5-semialdehyde dehydrogenase [Parabacteroides sp.]|nr:glutamate-5-semialdehyde dehydrogenase [Parabacteroides sp.]
MIAYEMIRKAANAVCSLQGCSNDKINDILIQTAARLKEKIRYVLSANEVDLAKMDKSNPKYDRLRLTEDRLLSIASDMENVAGLPSPLGKVLMEEQRPNGMLIKKVSVPFGVIGIIYEARPNVTFDVFSLCLKSGNVCVLKGGSDAENTNTALVEIIHEVLENNGLDKSLCVLLPAGRESTTCLLQSAGLVDLVIPRGSKALIQYVRENSRVPVIETGAGICHTYFDKYGDKEKGRIIINNAKTRRVSVCNALDCLVVHRDRLSDLPYLCGKLSESNVKIYADDESFLALDGNYPAELLFHSDENSYGTEFLDYKMSIKTVENTDSAISHIGKYSSKHSECIISEDDKLVDIFQRRVDAACVYSNVSTAFTDGAQFGFGAEIGISTQKMHARGPMALPELTTYKYLITGEGQIREK